jgi:glutaconate CoA-transferase subunit B
MRLTSLYPGVTLDEVRAAIGWDLRIADTLTDVPPPTEQELRIIRLELKVASAQRDE